MIHMLLSIAGWLRRSNSHQSELHHCLRLFADSTLLNPASPDESCSPQFIREMREISGFEPPTRTLVRSYAAGHTVQVLLLKNNERMLQAFGINRDSNREVFNARTVTEEV